MKKKVISQRKMIGEKRKSVKDPGRKVGGTRRKGEKVGQGLIRIRLGVMRKKEVAVEAAAEVVGEMMVMFLSVKS